VIVPYGRALLSTNCAVLVVILFVLFAMAGVHVVNLTPSTKAFLMLIRFLTLVPGRRSSTRQYKDWHGRYRW
jgi:hypothetical protein